MRLYVYASPNSSSTDKILQTMAMFLARIVFFRLHESPRYLVHAGRPQEAIESLQMISRFNGDELSLGLEDVRDSVYAPVISDEPTNTEPSSKHPTARESTAVVFDAGTQDDDPGYPSVHEAGGRQPMASADSRDLLRDSPESESKRYHATGESNVVLEGHYYHTPQISQISRTPSPAGSLRGRPKSPTPPDDEDKHSLLPEPSIAAPRPVSGIFADDILRAGEDEPRARLRPRLASQAGRRHSTASSMFEPRSKMYWRLPRWLRKPLWAWFDRIAMVLAPEWMRTTLLVWAAWFAMSLGGYMPVVRAFMVC